MESIAHSVFGDIPWIQQQQSFVWDRTLPGAETSSPDTRQDPKVELSFGQLGLNRTNPARRHPGLFECLSPTIAYIEYRREEKGSIEKTGKDFNKANCF